jgi:hypothetical protein
MSARAGTRASPTRVTNPIADLEDLVTPSIVVLDEAGA